MKTSPFACRLAIYVCVAMAFFLVVTQPVLSLVFACLIPFWFFLADVLIAPIRRARKVCKALSVSGFPVFSPRPPPTL
jgi:hypothetical protein